MKNLLILILSLFSFTYFVSNLQAQSIEGKVFIDYNANGKLDQNEPTNDGVFVTLFKNKQNNLVAVDSIKTDSAGYYKFENFGLGYYEVNFDYERYNKPLMGNFPNCDFYIDSINQKEVCNMSPLIPNCTSNPYSVENLCELAYSNPLCDLTVIGDFSCGQNPSELGPWNDSLHCGGKFENTSFYGFVAGTGNYQIQFFVFECGGAGFQYGLMDACNPSGSYLVCNRSGNSDTITIDASNLIPGKTYLFWIDGYKGAVCAYYIHVTGDYNYFKIPDIDDLHIEGISETACNPEGNYFINFDLEPSDTFSKENVSAFWEIRRPDGEIEKFTTVAASFDTLAYHFAQTGNYEICVATYNSCSLRSPIFCKEFEINVKQSEPPIEIVKKDFCFVEQPLAMTAINAHTGTILQNVIWSGLGIDSLGIFDPSVTGIGTHQIYLQVVIDSCFYRDTIEIKVRDYRIGDTCDDQDSTTIKDIVQSDCSCKGEKISSTNDYTNFDYTILPNPSKDKFIIKSLVNELVEIKIVNISGQVFAHLNSFVLNENQIDVSTWASGMYYVSVKTKNGVTALKFIKVE